MKAKIKKNKKPAKVVIKKPIKKEKMKKNEKQKTASDKNKKTWTALRGMHDILPKEEKYWKSMYNVSSKLAEYMQFARIETPILEEASLFIRSIGKTTDVVEKEMYVFDDSDGGKICLRPEATASVVRAYVSDGLWNNPQPVKVWYWGPMFRHDRPQAGRYRQFTQVGFENIGVLDSAADAELIMIAFNFYKDLKLPVEIHINSIGTPEERERYKNELLNYYRTKKSYLCEECRKRMQKNPLRLLDCKEEQCQGVKEEAPQIVDWLSENSKNYFMKVLEYLDELGVPYILRPSLVRGLDYYTHTVFEVYPISGEGAAQSALGGGGRYDLLVEELGGKSTPAAGMALGIDRSVIYMKEFYQQNQLRVEKEPYDIFFAQLGDRAKGRAMKILDDLRESNIKIAFNLYKNSLKTQLDIANELKVPYSLILGQKEVQEGTIIIRDMESGIQEIVDQKKIETALKKKLKKFDDTNK